MDLENQHQKNKEQVTKISISEQTKYGNLIIPKCQPDKKQTNNWTGRTHEIGSMLLWMLIWLSRKTLWNNGFHTIIATHTEAVDKTVLWDQIGSTYTSACFQSCINLIHVCKSHRWKGIWCSKDEILERFHAYHSEWAPRWTNVPRRISWKRCQPIRIYCISLTGMWPRYLTVWHIDFFAFHCI